MMLLEILMFREVKMKILQDKFINCKIMMMMMMMMMMIIIIASSDDGGGGSSGTTVKRLFLRSIHSDIFELLR
jgi:hypothetical protein